MSDTAIVLTHEAILAAHRDLWVVKPKNALVGSRLSKLRKAVAPHFQTIAESFADAGERHAVRENDTPVIVHVEGKPRSWNLTGTPAYVIDPAHQDEYAAEVKALMAETVTLTVRLLTQDDLAAMDASDNTDGLEPFIAPEAA